MKRFAFAILAPSLLFVVVFMSSCDYNPGATGQVVTCFGDIGLKVAVSVASDDAPLTIASLLSVVPECINAAIAAFSPPSNSNPSSPEVTINTSPTDGSSAGSVKSNTWSNCTDYAQTLTFNFTVPFAMVVGPQDSQESFTAVPGGTSDDELIAQQLFQQYGSYISSFTTNGPSQSIVLTVPAQTQVSLTLPIQLSYKEGEAQVLHTDGSPTTVPWLFTDGYQQNGQITYSSSSC